MIIFVHTIHNNKHTKYCFQSSYSVKVVLLFANPHVSDALCDSCFLRQTAAFLLFSLTPAISLFPPPFLPYHVSGFLWHISGIEEYFLPCISTRCLPFVFFNPQLARPETCCLRCWSSIPLNGYRWTRPYSTPTSTCGTIQLRWRRWVGLLAEQFIDYDPKLSPLLLSLYGRHCLLSICNAVQKRMTLLVLLNFFKEKQL